MNLIDYFGNFHPLAVHLPIGILSVFIVLAALKSRDELSRSLPLLRLMLLLSAITSTLSALTGFILYWSGSYEGSLVTGHQILGISLTAINWAIVLQLNYLLNCRMAIYRGTLLLVLFFMVMTGHAGGSLTHGEDFLTPPAPNEWFDAAPSGEKQISLNSSAYQAVSVIFAEKCQVCHGANKQKGTLRLDQPKFIKQGGKSGDFISEHSANSLLVQRILLPEDDEDHMPPKERKQLSQKEIDFLVWWVASGAQFEKTLQELEFPDSIHGILSGNNNEPASILPIEEVPKASDEVLKELRVLGVIVTPLASGTDYLSASFVNVLPENVSAAISQLGNIREQLIELDLAYQELDISSWQQTGNLSNLRKLDLRNTNLSDETLVKMASLSYLISLNLAGTKITFTGLKSLDNLEELHQIYLYQTQVKSKEFEQLQKMFPKVNIDTGNYLVPILASDTTVFKGNH